MSKRESEGKIEKGCDLNEIEGLIEKAQSLTDIISSISFRLHKNERDEEVPGAKVFYKRR